MSMFRLGQRSAWPERARDLDLALDKKLGEGGLGQVYWCRVRGRKVAVKVVPEEHARKRMTPSEHGLPGEREITVMRALDHPHIIRLLFSFRDAGNVYLGMEFAEGGSIYEQIGKLDKYRTAQYVYQTCDGLEYLHVLNYLHRDIKPENILLDRDGNVKLADFGFARIAEGDPVQSTCGTPVYMAPEMVQNHMGMDQPYDASLDMWCVGILTFEMLVGNPPFEGPNLVRQILACKVELPESMDANAKELILSLCRIASNERLTATQVKSHVFVIKNHHGRPTDGVPATADVVIDPLTPHEQNPFVSPHPYGNIVALLLKSKSNIEVQLLDLQTELDEAHASLQSEKERSAAHQKEVKLLLEAKKQQELQMLEMNETETELDVAKEQLQKEVERSKALEVAFSACSTELDDTRELLRKERERAQKLEDELAMLRTLKLNDKN